MKISCLSEWYWSVSSTGFSRIIKFIEIFRLFVSTIRIPNLWAILYYATREVKSWLVQSITCKLPPEPKPKVTNMCSGMALHIPVLRILFFTVPVPKMPHSPWAGSERENHWLIFINERSQHWEKKIFPTNSAY